MSEITELATWLREQAARDDRTARRWPPARRRDAAHRTAMKARIDLATMTAARWPTISLQLLRIEAHPYAGRPGWRDDWVLHDCER